MGEADGELGGEGGAVLLDGHGAAHRDGEVAVRAAAGAEGNVQVDVAGHVEISHESEPSDLAAQCALDESAQLEGAHGRKGLVRGEAGAR